MPNQTPSILNLQFLKGIETSKDDQLQLDGELLALNNGSINKLGRIEKRFGYDKLPNGILGGGSITTGRGLGIFDNELLLFDGYHAYSYSPGLSLWVNRGVSRSVLIDEEVQFRNDGYQATMPSLAILGNLSLCVWQDERNTIRCNLTDTETNVKILSDQAIDNQSAATEPVKAFAFGGKFIILYGTFGEIQYKTIDTSGNISGITSMVAATGSTSGFDACVITNNGTSRLFFITGDSSGPKVVSNYLTTSFTLGSSHNTTLPFSPVGGSNQEMTCFPDNAGRCHILIQTNDNSGHLDVYNAAVNFANNSTDIAAGIIFTQNSTTLSPHRLAGYVDDGYTMHAFVEHNDANSWHDCIWTNTCTLTPTRGTQSRFLRTVGIYSKFFRYGSSFYFVVARESQEQASQFLVDQSGLIVAKIAYQTSGGLESSYTATEIASPSDGVFAFAHTAVGRIETDEGFFFSRLGVNQATMDFSNQDGFVNASTTDQFLCAGGVVESYDRNKFSELNYHIYPENLSAVQQSSGSLTALGSYQYKATYEWTDANGNQVVSRPSTPLTVVLTSGKLGAIITIPVLSLTNKGDGIRIELYRTEANGSIFFKITSSALPLYNFVDSDSVSITDTASDLSIIGNQEIYSDGEDNNLGPGSARLLVAHKDRIFLSGLEKNDTVQFTKILTSGISAETVDDPIFTQKISAIRGRITEIARLDDALIIFKENAMFALTGEGPDNSGSATAYSSTGIPVERPLVLSESIGCVRPNCSAEAPPGLFFVSHKGIYLLDRSKTLSYIGSPVAQFNNKTFTSVDKLPDSNQVRFTTLDGYALCYDYYYQNWSSWQIRQGFISIVDAAVWNDQHILLSSDGYCYLQKDASSNDPYLDDGYSISMSATSSWYQPSGLLGAAQLNRILIAGTFIDSHHLTITTSFNQDPSFNKISTADMNAICSAPNLPYTIEQTVFRYLSSFQITLSEDGNGASAVWSGLRAEVIPQDRLHLPGKRRR